jgi:hypothetical protein
MRKRIKFFSAQNVPAQTVIHSPWIESQGAERIMFHLMNANMVTFEEGEAEALIQWSHDGVIAIGEETFNHTTVKAKYFKLRYTNTEMDDQIVTAEVLLIKD